VLERNDAGVWQYVGGRLPSRWDPAYAESVVRYLTALDAAFTRARHACEFEFLCALLRVRGVKSPGWDPYEATTRMFKNLVGLSNKIRDFELRRHLHLWLYGHMVEASEPYELLANLISISTGGRYHYTWFPPKWGQRPQSPGEKIQSIAEMAATAGMAQVVEPVKEIWDRDLRNAIFHSDYALYGTEVRILSPVRRYMHEDIMTLLNRALAYFESIRNLHRMHIAAYDAPRVIDVHPEFSEDPEEKAVVIVREGHGAVGLKDNWTPEQLRAGKIPFCIGQFYPDESQALSRDLVLR